MEEKLKKAETIIFTIEGILWLALLGIGMGLKNNLILFSGMIILPVIIIITIIVIAELWNDFYYYKNSND